MGVPHVFDAHLKKKIAMKSSRSHLPFFFLNLLIFGICLFFGRGVLVLAFLSFLFRDFSFTVCKVLNFVEVF